MPTIANLSPLLAAGEKAAEAMPFWTTNWFEMLIGALVTMVLPFALKLLNEYVDAFKQSNWDERAMMFTQAYWGSTIKGINQKKADGKITAAEASAQKTEAMTNLIPAFQEAMGGKAKVASGLGVAVEHVDTATRGLLEKSVTTSKNAGKQARSGN